jgi:hypothetical protein
MSPFFLTKKSCHKSAVSGVYSIGSAKVVGRDTRRKRIVKSRGARVTIQNSRRIIVRQDRLQEGLSLTVATEEQQVAR